MMKSIVYSLSVCVLACGLVGCQLPEVKPSFRDEIASLEADEGGQIGMAALNLETGQRLDYRSDYTFALCSTHKLLLVGAVLSRVDEWQELLDRRVAFTEDDIQEYAPVARQHLAKGSMTIEELSEAAIIYSDNTAANLLLQSIGGPEALTTYLRELGDRVTRLDRYEPEVNSNLSGDLRDTTTPRSMLYLMQDMLLGNELKPDSRERLLTWLKRNTTGAKKLRAAMPPDWVVGDKTGSGSNEASSDVAIVWPKKKKPFLVAVYYSGGPEDTDRQSKVIAAVGRIVRQEFYPEKMIEQKPVVYTHKKKKGAVR